MTRGIPENETYLDLLLDDAHHHEPSDIGMVGERNNINFSDRTLSAVAPESERIGTYAGYQSTDRHAASKAAFPFSRGAWAAYLATVQEQPPTRFGIIALAGRPNAGKSTLLNAIVGERLAIISSKPQSTRFPLIGIHTEGDTQLAFVDPPGLLTPANLLQESMLESALEAVSQAQAILYLHPLTEGEPPPLDSVIPRDRRGSQPVGTVLTKSDLVPEDRLPPTVPPVFVVSALEARGIDVLLDWCRSLARPGPFRYPEDDISAQPLRFFASEAVREAAFEVLEQELPYAMAPEVDEFREHTTPVYIRVVLYVERDSQKGIVIGKGGETIKRIGRLARSKLERLLGEHVYLDLWVKVLAHWRNSESALRRLGLPSVPKSKRRS